jgi:hypothetical protein
MTSSWILIAGCGVVTALPILTRALQRRLDPFEPVVLFSLAWAVMFVLRPSVMIADGSFGFWGVDLRGTLPLALFLGLVGAVAFVCGYELRAGASLARRLPTPGELDTRATAVSGIAVAVIGVVFFVVLLPASDPLESLRVVLGGRDKALGEVLADSSTYVFYASWALVPASLVLAGVAFRARRPVYWILAGVVLGVALLRTVPFGSRMALLPLLGGLLVLWYVLQGRRPSVRSVALLALAAVCLSYVLVVVRDPERRGDLSGEVRRVVERPHAILYPLTGGEDAEMVPALAGALTAIPDELGYRFGAATLGDLVSRPIPRELWADKPLPAREQVIRQVWPQFYPGLNPTFTPILAFYRDLSVAGVVIGMALLGIAARVLYAWFRARSESFAAQLLFAATVWFTVIAIRNDPVDTVVFALFLVAPVIAIVAVSGDTGRLANALRRTPPEPDHARTPRSATRDTAPL